MSKDWNGVPDREPLTATTTRAGDERQYDPATQPGSPEFDGAEAYEAHLAALYPEDTEPAENFVFPPMPNAVVNHEKVGPLFDRLSMHFYASKCMRLAEKARAALATAPEQAGEHHFVPYYEGVEICEQCKATRTAHAALGSTETAAEQCKRCGCEWKHCQCGTSPTDTAPPPASTNRLTDILAFKEALHEHFNAFPIPTQIGVTAIMKHIEKVYTAIIAATEGK